MRKIDEAVSFIFFCVCIYFSSYESSNIVCVSLKIGYVISKLYDSYILSIIQNG